MGNVELEFDDCKRGGAALTQTFSLLFVVGHAHFASRRYRKCIHAGDVLN